ncbi:MAG: polysaccharide deacetylase family protein [Bacteroidetes bacterium]|nr:polysaccharide deacetylase family protein [Bacteroidota bacterium]
MLNFRNTTVLFVLLLVVLMVLNFYMHIPVFIYIALALIYSFILFLGSYFIQLNFYIKAICKSETTKKEIALSFDDGPAVSFSPEILNVLEEHNVKVAFFCIGNRIEGNEKIVRDMYEQGHVIGNHSFSHHLWFDLFSSKKMLADMKQMNERMKDVIGVAPKLFRPPYGVTNPNLKKAIIKGDYTTIGWNVRSMDTVINDEKKLVEKMKKAISPGAIILFHDTSKTTLNILPEFIKYVKAEGYDITRLDKMLNLNPYA